MSQFCSCPNGPRCEYHHCGDPADWSVWQPTWPTPTNKTGQPGNFKFMCGRCAKIYRDAMTKRIPGIDRPENAPDDWKGSILDCVRLAQIAMAFEDRNKKPAKLQQHGLRRHGDEKYTPAQLQQIMVLRKRLSAFPSAVGGAGPEKER